MDHREGRKHKHTHIPFHVAIDEFKNKSRFEEARSPQRLDSNESSSAIAHGRVASSYGGHSCDSDNEMVVIDHSDTLSGPPSIVTDTEIVDRRRTFPPTSDQTFSELRGLLNRCREVLFQLSADGSAEDVDATETMASLNIWAANMGVFREGRQSLAARLKNAPQIVWLVQQLLVALKNHLEKKVQEDDGEEEEDPSVSASDDSSDRSSTPSYKLQLSDDEEGFSPSANGMNTWASIQDITNSLRQLALNTHVAGFQHRQERVLRFKGLERNRQVIGLFEFLARQHVDHNFPKAGEYLLKRVADSIATRRARFMYLELHQKKTSTLNEPAPMLGLAEHSVETEKTFPEIQSSEGQNSKVTLPQGEVRKMSLPPSVTLSKTLVTQLDEKLFDQATNNNKRAQSVTSVQISTGNFPSRPKLDPGGFSFTCPYCFLVCPAKEVSSQKEWMGHLIHDFEPFFCVFEECESPFACAGSQSGWLNHMRDKHTKPKWECCYCQPSSVSMSFQTPKDLERHLSTQHAKEVAASLRPTLVKHSMISDQYVLNNCPFCGGFPEEIERVNPDRNSKQALEALQKHVRDHLISEALVLAPTQWEEPEGELDDTLSEPQAQIDKNSGRDLEEFRDDYDMEWLNISRDFKKNTSISEWSPDPASATVEDNDETQTHIEANENPTRHDLRTAINLAADLLGTYPERALEAAEIISDALSWTATEETSDDDVTLAKEQLILCYLETGDLGKAEGLSRQVLRARMAKRPPVMLLVRAARQKLTQVLKGISAQYRDQDDDDKANQAIGEALDLAVMNISTRNNPKISEDAEDVLHCCSILLDHSSELPKERVRLIELRLMALQKTGDSDSFEDLHRITLERHQLLRAYVLELEDKAQGGKVYDEAQNAIETFELRSIDHKEAATSLLVETEALWESLLSLQSDNANERTSKRIRGLDDQEEEGEKVGDDDSEDDNLGNIYLSGYDKRNGYLRTGYLGDDDSGSDDSSIPVVRQESARASPSVADSSEIRENFVSFDAMPASGNEASERWIQDFIQFRRGILPDEFDKTATEPTRITIIDTGIDASHPFIERHWHRCRRQADGTELPLFKDFDHFLDVPIDDDGHGTFVAGLVFRLAPDVELSVARVCQSQASMSHDSRWQAIYHAQNTWEADIILTGFGSHEDPTGELRAAIHKVRNSNVIFLSAAGALGSFPTLPMPARLSGVFKISACDHNGYSQTMGRRITSDGDYCFSILGSNLKSTWPMSLKADGIESGLEMAEDGDPELPGLWTVMSGTSFATPVAAALVAIVYQFYDKNRAVHMKSLPSHVYFKTPEVVKAILLKMSLFGLDGYNILAPTSGKDNYFKFYPQVGKSQTVFFAEALTYILWNL